MLWQFWNIYCLHVGSDCSCTALNSVLTAALLCLGAHAQRRHTVVVLSVYLSVYLSVTRILRRLLKTKCWYEHYMYITTFAQT